MISSISISDFIKSSPSGKIIDIRSIEKYNSNHIPDAKNIPMEKLIAEPQKYLDRYQTYYVYCQKGIKSIRTCQILQRLGYRVVNINGGYESWILEK
jgi:rhodanese-related sulfurtransferase